MISKKLFEKLGFKLIDFNKKYIVYRLKNDYEDYAIIFNLNMKNYDVYFYNWWDNDVGNSVPMHERTEALKHCAKYGHWQAVHLAMPFELHYAISKQIEELEGCKNAD